MITSIILAHALLAVKRDGVMWKKTLLNMPAKSNTLLMFQGPVDPIEPPKLSPKKFGVDKLPWEFPWMVEGFSQTTAQGYQKCFRVFSQENRGDKVSQISQMLLRLWDFNYKNLKLVHSPVYNGGLVEVYLCFGGRAGGEQLFDVDAGMNLQTHQPVDVKVNTIYIYDMPSFTDPVEMAREVAHEYGHATLPPIGGYKAPEDWADGYLGEKLYLTWARDALAAGTLVPGDLMGVSKEGLDKWIATNVDPLVEKALVTKPTLALLSDNSAEGMNAFNGLALAIDSVFGHNVFARSIKMTGSYDAKDYPAAAVLAVEEPDEVTLHIPQNLIGKYIWIPLGTGKLKGTTWNKHDPSGWVQILAKSGEISISNVH